MQLAQIAEFAPTWEISMQPATIICDNHLDSGMPCGETALIHSVQYVYDRDTGTQAASHVLRESHYVIDCPRCGRRTQVERFD
jgi:hypothetical protein